MAQKSEKLIGKTINGAKVDDILIVPTNSEQRDSFIKEYITTMNAKSAILPYMSFDVNVEALFNKDMIFTNGAYLFCDVLKLHSNFDE